MDTEVVGLRYTSEQAEKDHDHAEKHHDEIYKQLGLQGARVNVLEERVAELRVVTGLVLRMPGVPTTSPQARQVINNLREEIAGLREAIAGLRELLPRGAEGRINEPERTLPTPPQPAPVEDESTE